MAIIEFEDVTKTYGRPGRVPPALQEVTFEIEPGEFVLLMGPSGAGKSTLLKLILAMERPEQGQIHVAGRDVHRLTKGSIPFLRRNIGAVFQDFKLLPEATPLENVGLALQVLGLPRNDVLERAQRALDSVNLDPTSRRPVRAMSGGEQQRVALARASATRCCSPPDMARTGRRLVGSRLTESRARWARSRTSLRGSPSTWRARPTFSSGVASGRSLKSWKTAPMLRRRKGIEPLVSRCTSRPATWIWPCSGRSIARMSLSRVDLPAPLGPIRSTNSPGSISKVTSCNAGGTRPGRP